MLDGSHDMRDAHLVIIHDTGQVIQAASIGSLNDVILFCCPLKFDSSTHSIVKSAHAFSWHLQPDYAAAPLGLEGRCLCLGSGHPLPIVHKRSPGLLGCLALCRKFLWKRVIAVGMSTFNQLLCGSLISVVAL
jgi:hypothetical protein